MSSPLIAVRGENNTSVSKQQKTNNPWDQNSPSPLEIKLSTAQLNNSSLID